MPQIHEVYPSAFNRSLESFWKRSLIWGVRSGFVFVALAIGGLAAPFPANLIWEILLTIAFCLFQLIFQWPFRLLYRSSDPLPEVELSGGTVIVRRGKHVLIESAIERTTCVDDEEFWRMVFYRKRPFPLVLTFQNARWWRGEPKSVAVGFTDEMRTCWREAVECDTTAKIANQ